MRLQQSFSLSCFSLCFVFTAANSSAAIVIDFVNVGDPGNNPLLVEMHDGTSGYGAVDYAFRIGEFEVTNAQYAAFLNAVASIDTYKLYNNQMGASVFGGIIRSGTNGNYSYSLKPNMANKPVNLVTFFDAARFINWLENGQPSGSQNSSTTEDGTYTFSGEEIVGPRKPGSTYFLPNEHEWLKAAFYQPGAVTDDGDEYWLYATGSDVPVIDALSDSVGNVTNHGPNTIVHGAKANWGGSSGTGNVMTVGSAGNQTYYGAKDMGGNVFEWQEADLTKYDPLGAGPYMVKGGSFQNYGHVFNTERGNGTTIGDGDTDGADFLMWQRQYHNFPGPLFADFNRDYKVDELDLALWQASYGLNAGGDGDRAGHIHNVANKTVGFRVAAAALPLAVSVPEPSSLVLASVGILMFVRFRRVTEA